MVAYYGLALSVRLSVCPIPVHKSKTAACRNFNLREILPKSLSVFLRNVVLPELRFKVMIYSFMHRSTASNQPKGLPKRLIFQGCCCWWWWWWRRRFQSSVFQVLCAYKLQLNSRWFRFNCHVVYLVALFCSQKLFEDVDNAIVFILKKWRQRKILKLSFLVIWNGNTV